GDPADAAFFVVFGRLRVEADAAKGGEAEVRAGELVGTAALLEGGTRARTVSAMRDSYLVRMPGDVIELLAARHPEAVLELARGLVRQFTQPEVRPAAAQGSSIAIIPVGLDVELRMFCSRLVEILSAHGPTFHVWSARVDSALGRAGISDSAPSDAGHMRVMRWLHQVEDAHRFMLFETDGTDSGWTRRALRQADRVLIVADASHEPAGLHPGVRKLLKEGGPRVSLVLLQRGGPKLPEGTDRWLDAAGVEEVIHVRRGSITDMTRLGRVLAGRGVGLVLSGGGARGFAHLGVLRALHELNVPVDLVGGASMGAAMGVSAAMGTPVDDLIPLAKRRFARLRDYTIPMVSILKGRRITQAMRAELGDHLIEDLWLPFFAITTNLTTFGEVVHRRGPLVPALRATVAIPGVLPPAPMNGELHVDGGVINDFPIDVMRRIHPDSIVIGSDVTPRRGPSAKVDYGLWISGSRAIGKRVGRRQRLPGLGDTMTRAMTVSAMRQRDRSIADSNADLVMHLDMRGIGMLDFEEVEKAAERGYEGAMPQLEAWLSGRDDLRGEG
ncbi:MAG: patatin-like phospholipase family protein, partial [Actinobacteria bacterium]|nr:patatin-like phospholipase family protein [Actinomycetota bacterium]